jgi:ketosteroid isomerase-like protein
MSPNAASKQDILDLEARLTLATQHIDVDTLDGLYADDIIFTGVTGAVCDKRSVMDEARRGAAERAKAASAGAPAVVGYEKDDIVVAAHDGIAVTSFRFGVTIRAEGKEVVRRYRTTNVWAKRAGSWQVVAAHTAALG